MTGGAEPGAGPGAGSSCSRGGLSVREGRGVVGGRGGGLQHYQDSIINFNFSKNDLFPVSAPTLSHCAALSPADTLCWARVSSARREQMPAAFTIACSRDISDSSVCFTPL